jgi:hypothetical protein
MDYKALILWEVGLEVLGRFFAVLKKNSAFDFFFVSLFPQQ